MKIGDTPHPKVVGNRSNCTVKFEPLAWFFSSHFSFVGNPRGAPEARGQQGQLAPVYKEGIPQATPQKQKAQTKAASTETGTPFPSPSPLLSFSLFLYSFFLSCYLCHQKCLHIQVLVFCINYNKYRTKLRNDHVFSCFQQIAINSMNSFNIYIYSIFFRAAQPDQ